MHSSCTTVNEPMSLVAVLQTEQSAAKANMLWEVSLCSASSLIAMPIVGMCS